MNPELLPYVGGVLAVLSSFFGAFASGGSSLLLMGSLVLVTSAPYLFLLTLAKVAGAAMIMVSSLLHRKRTRVNASLVVVMTLTGLLGMSLATWLLQSHNNDRFFEYLNGFLLISLGLYLIFSKTKGQSSSGRTFFNTWELLEAGFVLLLFSFLNGFSGGMGFVVNAYLLLRFRMSFIEATAYTMIAGVLVITAQALYLVSTVNVDFKLLSFVVLGSLLGGYLGTKMQYLHGNRTVKWAVICMMLILGLSIFVH